MSSISGATVSDGTVQAPSGTSLSIADSVGTLTDILPSPACSRRSRRQRPPIMNTFMSHESTVPLDHVAEKSSVDISSTDEVPLDFLSSRSDYKVSLDQCITGKCDSTVPLDPLSTRSVIPVTLDLNKKSSLDD